MIRLVSISTLAALAAVGCTGRERDAASAPEKTAPPSAPAPTAPVVASPAAADAAPAPVPAVPAAGPLKDHMKEHFAAVRAIERALVKSKLEVVHERAQWIADHDEHSDLDGWKPHVEAMRAAARELAVAEDLAAAAALTATLGRRCASCHEARSAIVAFPWEPEPENVPGLAAQMKRHQWAAERLWEGVVGPSDALWKSGAATLFAARIDVDVAGKHGDLAEVKAAAARLHALAGKARSTATEDRAALYGELLSTCAGCHANARDPAAGGDAPAPASPASP